MAFTRNVGYMEGSGDPNLDATINAGGGNLPTLYVDTSVSPVQLYESTSNSVPNKWQKIGFDKFLPWVKTGNTFENGTTSVVSGDDVFRTGKTNMGADEATMPFETQYRQKFYGNSYNQGKFVNLAYNINTITTVNVSVNPTTGNDSLDDTAYPSAVFQTLTKCLDWVEKCRAGRFNITVSGTSVGSKATLGTARSLHNKVLVFAAGYYDFSAAMTCFNCHIQFNTCELYFNVSTAITGINCCLYLSNGSLTYNAAGSIAALNLLNRSELVLKCAWTLTFTQNNQSLLQSGVSNNFKVQVLANGKLTFVTTGVTGCKFVQSGATNPSLLAVPKNGTVTIIPNAMSFENVIVERAFEGFSLGGFDITNDYGKNLALHSAKALYTPNEQTFADNEAAITGGCIVGEHYKTPDGKQQVVVASNPTIPKIYTLILRFDLDTIGFDSLSAGDPISGTILYDDCTLGTGLSVSKNDSVSNSAPCIRIGIDKSFEIVEINNIFFREDDRYYLTEYGFNDGEYNVIDIIAWRNGALNAIGENLGFITTTIKFIKP